MFKPQKEHVEPRDDDEGSGASTVTLALCLDRKNLAVRDTVATTRSTSFRDSPRATEVEARPSR